MLPPLSTKREGEKGGMPGWIKKMLGKDFERLGFDKNVEPGMLSPILGGSPKEKQQAYSFFSPLIYVSDRSPVTLIIHGKQDILAPVQAICRLYNRLKENNIPVIMHLVPQTDHAFDLILPKFSPSAQNAIYDIERFLAIMAEKKVSKAKQVEKFAEAELVQ